MPLPPRRRPGPELDREIRDSRGLAPEDWFQSAARIALSDDPAAPDVLVTHLAGARASDVASALVLLGGDAAREALLVGLDHAEEEVAVRAAAGLGILGDSRALEAVTAYLSRPDVRSGCAEVLGAAVSLAGAWPPSRANRQRILDAAVASPTPCGVAAREIAVAALRLGDPSGATSLLSPDVLEEGPLPDEIVAALADSAGDVVGARAREIVQRSEDPDLLFAGLRVLAAAGDAEGLDRAAERLRRADLGSCAAVSGDVVAAPRACEAVTTLVVELARAGHAGVADVARALTATASPRFPPDVAFEGFVARVYLGDEAVAGTLRNLLASGGDAADRLVGLDPVPDLVRSALLPPGAPRPQRAPACRVPLAARDSTALEAARSYLSADVVPEACRALSTRVVLDRGRGEDHVALREALSRRAETLGGGAGSLSDEERAEAAWLVPALAEFPPEQRVPWEVSRRLYLRLAGGGVEGGALRHDVLRAVLAVRPRPSPPSSPRLLDAVRSVSCRPAVSATALQNLGAVPDDPTRAGSVLEMLAPGAGASPSARVPDLDPGVATARLRAGALAAGLAEVARERLPSLDPDGATALTEIAVRHGGLPSPELVPLLEITRAPGLGAVLALGCDVSCEGPLRSVMAGPSPWGRATAAAVVGAAGLGGLENELRLLGRSARNEPGKAEAVVALRLLGSRDPALGAQMQALVANAAPPVQARAWVAAMSAGTADAPRLPDTPVPEECANHGTDPLGRLLTAAVAVRALPRALGTVPPDRRGEVATLLGWSAACLAAGTGLGLPEYARAFETAPAALRRALVPVAVEEARRSPAAAWLPPLATDDDTTVREHVASTLAIAVPGRERQRFAAVVRLLAGDAFPEVRAVAVRSLPFESTEADEVAARALEDSAPEVRRAIVSNPGLSRSLAGLLVARLVEDPDPEVRRTLAARLREAEYPLGRAVLRRLVGDPVARSIAFAALCDRGTPDDLEAAVDALAAVPRRDRAGLLEGCASVRRLVGRDPAVLLRVVGGRDWRRAAAAVSLVGLLGPEERLLVLERARRQRVSAVRIEAAAFAVEAMEDEDEAPGGADVALAFLVDRDRTVRCAALAGAETPTARTLVADLLGRGRVPPDLDELWRTYRCAERRLP